MIDIRIRIESLLKEIGERVYEKEHIISLSLLSAIAGESIFLLGPPGVAKSMVARRLKLAFKKARAFEYLMSRFSTPDEIFGPVSISKLKDEDTYERITEGYLPTADIVFLDEIWKAGPAIQNALLTVINEKIYRNGQFSVKVPLKGLIAASNELPATDQGLDALWDRFLVRLFVGGIEDMGEFDRMITDVNESEPIVDESLALSNEEYEQMMSEVSKTTINFSILEVIHFLRDQIAHYNQEIDKESSEQLPIYISDRRWKKIIRLLRASAYINNREQVGFSDCLLITHCLWSELEHREMAIEMVKKAITESTENYVLNSKDLMYNLQEFRQQLASCNSLSDEPDPALLLVDSFYHQIEGVRMKEKLLIFAADYQKLSKSGMLFVLHKDKYKTNCCILKKFDPILHSKVPQGQTYNVKRGVRSVIINEVEYALLCNKDSVPPPSIQKLKENYKFLEEKIVRIEKDLEHLLSIETTHMEQNLFLSKDEKRLFKNLLNLQRLSFIRYKNEFNELKDAYEQAT